MGYFRARKVDANQKSIISVLESAFCHVTDLSSVGRGCPDLLVLAPNQKRPVLLEVKNKLGRGDKLTKAQEKFHKAYWGTIHRVTGPVEAISAVFGIVGRSTPLE